MSVETGFNWFGFVTQIVAVVVGGVLVIVANEWAERRRRISAYEDLRQHERAVLTGVFAVRNFIAEQLNAFEETGSTQRDLLTLEVAQRNLNRLIDKSRASGQSLLLVLFEISLRLDDLLAATRRSLDEENTDIAGVVSKINALSASLDHFDLVSGSSLEFLTEEELEDLTNHRQ